MVFKVPSQQNHSGILRPKFSVNSSTRLKGSKKVQNKQGKKKSKPQKQQPYNGQEDKLISKSHQGFNNQIQEMRVHYCTAHTRKLKLDLMKDDLTRHRFISQTSPSPALAGDVYCESLLPSIRPAARLNCSCFSYVKRMCSRANAS